MQQCFLNHQTDKNTAVLMGLFDEATSKKIIHLIERININAEVAYYSIN